MSVVMQPRSSADAEAGSRSWSGRKVRVMVNLGISVIVVVRWQSCAFSLVDVSTSA